ncbi:hypothetical protein A5821_002740 [Enterococcus sp. 7F3_DIV0205]|uniref:GmrSD restriction endonucleases N-terminal domain-containing protein n=1 Tax=Candidatus Enterococcus palustris TaxID=1834189 RepID=A0AAQ3WAB1_9ENTE|nr:DUF262 domain-containing protein [Enterococcus sp. 7F3_DIV0205]OTN83174.1 hypothetical protein A5821_003097 [Enterococcus sp. 7F3_DIV0205]
MDKSDLKKIQEKAKERTVRTQDVEYDLETLVKKVDNQVIKLDPEYQRRHVWNDVTSSRLIESLILNIPIPIIFISQDIDVDDENVDDIARYSVIDGQQRLTAIVNFFHNEYELTGMEILSDLNGYKYSGLPGFLIRRLEERTIKCLRIDSSVDSQVKYDIFERLNSGSVKLESQELRNASHRGPFNDLIKKLSENEDFRILLQVNLNKPQENKKVKRMEDVETVLRFFAFGDDKYHDMKGGLKYFLSTSMKKFNELDNHSLSLMEKHFNRTMKVIREEFGEKAFAKYKFIKEENDYKEMSSFNVSVYDAIAVAVGDTLLSKDKLKSNSRESVKKLFSDEDFFRYIEGSTNDKAKIVGRINAVKGVL